MSQAKEKIHRSGPPLTVEQLKQIEQKRHEALRRLAARNDPMPIGESWHNHIRTEFTKPYFTKVKVVILGQDPYPRQSQAHGLCFSVLRPSPPPPSLENIFTELAIDIKDFQHPGHGDLTGWAKQGVLLLNSVLTVRSREPASHQGQGWEEFTDAVVQSLSRNLKGLVFLLWGSYAQRKGKFINWSDHHVLETSHPSPYSAHMGFFGCRHFSKTNILLRASGKTPIDWNAL
ncbi:uracil-DNA glycosylase isoform X4 [Tachysurus fulvidraco]|uniref:uracil-DNA glycosylase isoform X4 n=1 Tax=Tachysurus fulvidraco TaxID=1234273 RepID=UPI000F4E9464|nr:uracil-DNA glycosylase isoform X4 [Tachysurus fulvidraco]